MDREQIRRKVFEYSTRLNVTLGSIDDLADSMMRDSIEMFKKKGIFRQTLKYHSKQALKESERILSCYRQGTQAPYLDFLDIIQDEIQPDIERLYYAIKHVLDRNKVEDAEMRARVLQTYVMTEMAMKGYERFKDLLERTTHSRLEKALHELNPANVIFHWRQVTEIIFGRIHDEIAQDANVSTGVEVVCQKLFDIDWLEEKAQRAIAL